MLMGVKRIGRRTAGVYLLTALAGPDVWPRGVKVSRRIS